MYVCMYVQTCQVIGKEPEEGAARFFQLVIYSWKSHESYLETRIRIYKENKEFSFHTTGSIAGTFETLHLEQMFCSYAFAIATNRLWVGTWLGNHATFTI